MTQNDISLRCADKYEAQKLASMILVKRQTYLESIINVIGNELIITLHDHSAHSIVMHDRTQAEDLAAYLQSVLDKIHRIVRAEASDDIVYFSKV